MKSKHKFVVRSDAHMLSELTEVANAAFRRAGMARYLNSDAHLQFLVATSLTEQCDDSRRNLLKGKIAPRLDICCCASTFAAILTAKPRVEYTACELPETDESDPSDDDVSEVYVDEEIDDATLARLSKLSAEKLRAKLLDDYGCSEADYYHVHEADKRAQDAYYKALCARLEAAAQYAKAIGSESARLWLEALCLVSVDHDKDSEILHLDPDRVAEAYEVARRAQRALWVDDKLRSLPAAKLPRKPRSR